MASSSVTSCSSWSNTLSAYELDAPWNAARAFAIGADICIVIATMSCLVMTCAAVPTLVIKMTACLFFLGFLFESLIFIAFSSDVCTTTFSCKFNSGAGTAIAAILFAFFAAVAAAKIPPPNVDEDFIPGEGQAAGTAKVENSVENKDDNHYSSWWQPYGKSEEKWFSVQE